VNIGWRILQVYQAPTRPSQGHRRREHLLVICPRIQANASSRPPSKRAANRALAWNHSVSSVRQGRDPNKATAVRRSRAEIMRFVLSRDQRVAIVRQRRRGFFLSPLNKAYICRLRTAVSGCQYVRVRRQTSGTGLRGSPPRIRIEESTDGVNACFVSFRQSTRQSVQLSLSV
jgi:hypothetical protein